MLSPSKNSMKSLGPWNRIQGRFTQGPTHFKSIHASSAVESMEVGTYHFTRIPRPKYNMDAYMETLFESEPWDLC